MRFALPLCLVACSLASAQTSPAPYLDPTLSAHARAVDLVGRMTLDEKVSQMGNLSAAVPRLQVPAYNWWNEALHGVARSGYATMFPQAIGMAAAWDAPLMQQIGDAIATEARAKNNEALRHGNHSIYFGLDFWSPNINIFRDPRWGRGQETYGEDPYLTAQLGVNFVRGLQGSDPRYLKVIATPKHFAVHSGPESERHKFNVEPSAHDLWDTYLPQFRAAIVDGKADSIMCAYNRVNGAPACGSTMLLSDVLRRDWGFNGYVTSDCGAIDDFYASYGHKTDPDAEHADKTALLAGTDTVCGGTYRKLDAAVKDSLVKESDIDVSLVRLFEARMRLGLFDPPAQVPYAHIPFSAVHSSANAALAKRAADESMVLLKNDGILPLAPGKYRTVAVIGPNAASLAALEGNYNGVPHTPALPVDAITTALPGATVLYAAGAPYVEGFAMPVPRTMLHPARGSAQHGLKAEYFSNTTFLGTPSHSAVDPQLDFDWDGVNPLPGTSAGGFAVRWTGAISAPAAGMYTFTVKTGRCEGCLTTQRVRVLLDGKEVAATAALPPDTSPAQTDSFTGLPVEHRHQKPLTFPVSFTEGEQHSLQVEFVRDTAERGSGIVLQWTPNAAQLLPEAIATARQADVVVAMLGLSPDLEGEEMPVKLPGFAGGDRTDIALPATQQALLRALLDTGKPVIAVLLNGSAITINMAQNTAKAVLEAWYPGEAGGKAIADVLTGAVNPSGRLPVTFYASTADLPDFSDYSMKGRTYRYYTGQPLFSFGYGLSYTTFTYSKPRVAKDTLTAGDTLTVQADVKNTGKRAGAEVAQLYLMAPADGNGGLSPKLQLEGFQRLMLQPGESRTVTFTLDPRQLSEVDAAGVRSVQPGSYRLAIGGAQPGDPHATAQAQTALFTITGRQPLAK